MHNDNQDHPSQQAKVRCFGNSAALTVEATMLMPKCVFAGHTVSLEVAPKQGTDIDWGRKIVLQLGDSELPILACVLLGLLPNAQFKRPDKGIVIERQPNRIYISATQGSGNVFALPLPIGQTYQVSALVLKQLQLLSQADMDTVLAALRGAAGLYRAKTLAGEA